MSSGYGICSGDGYYRSEKGASVHRNKLSLYCLKPGAKHSDDFFGIGYGVDSERELFCDMEKEFDLSKKEDMQIVPGGQERFSIPMKLGVDRKRSFRTVWMNDGPDGSARFITAYIDRRLERG